MPDGNSSISCSPGASDVTTTRRDFCHTEWTKLRLVSRVSGPAAHRFRRCLVRFQLLCEVCHALRQQPLELKDFAVAPRRALQRSVQARWLLLRCGHEDC
jgi:hypothetical protein